MSFDVTLRLESKDVNIEECRNRSSKSSGRTLKAAAAGSPLDKNQAADLAKVFKALGDPVRLRLLSMIASRDGVRSACAS